MPALMMIERGKNWNPVLGRYEILLFSPTFAYHPSKGKDFGFAKIWQGKNKRSVLWRAVIMAQEWGIDKVYVDSMVRRSFFAVPECINGIKIVDLRKGKFIGMLQFLKN